jgi:hypothetical protein
MIDPNTENHEIFFPQQQELEKVVKQPNWVRRNLSKMSVGAFAAGLALESIIDPLSKLENEIIHSGPWAAGGIVTTETAWIGGLSVMAVATGKKVGNPLKLKGRFEEISSEVVDSKSFRAGLYTNTVGAYGTAGVIAVGAIAALPVETWPGAIGIAAADAMLTKGIRIAPYAAIRKSKAETRAAKPKVSVRHATIEDIDRLADIDLLLFESAYGSQKPEKKEVVEGFTKRFNNNPGWMYVAEMNGKIEGFLTAFRTNQPSESFESWEECTANGTLEGKVDPKGKYVYIANMTIKHEAVKQGAEDMLLANMLANAIKDGVDYGYFVSRMPHFKRWLEANNSIATTETKESLAKEYLKLTDGKGKRYDPQLRMYESYGCEMKQMVADAFEDEASLNYGVLFEVKCPPNNFLKKIKPVRSLLATALRQIAKSPSLSKRFF